MKRLLVLIILILVSGCAEWTSGQYSGQYSEAYSQSHNRKWAATTALSEEIQQHNRKLDQLDKEVLQYKEQFEEYQNHYNAFIMSLNEEQLKLHQKIENESQSWSETNSATLSAGYILACRNFEESLTQTSNKLADLTKPGKPSFEQIIGKVEPAPTEPKYKLPGEEKLQTWLWLGVEFYKLEEKRQELLARTVKWVERSKELDQKRDEFIRWQEQNRQMALKLIPYKWEQQQRELDRKHDAQQRQLDRMYYRPPVFYGQHNQDLPYIPYDPRTDPWQYYRQGLQNIVDGLNK